MPGKKRVLTGCCRRASPASPDRAAHTACRVGELLSLQWKNVRTTTTPTGQTRQWLVLQKEKTKTARDARSPGRDAFATSWRCAERPGWPAVPPQAYVFGNSRRRADVSIKKAWMTTVHEAYGHTPQVGEGRQKSVERRESRRVSRHRSPRHTGRFTEGSRESPWSNQVRPWWRRSSVWATVRCPKRRRISRVRFRRWKWRWRAGKPRETVKWSTRISTPSNTRLRLRRCLARFTDSRVALG